MLRIKKEKLINEKKLNLGIIVGSVGVRSVVPRFFSDSVIIKGNSAQILEK